jgi:uncharacterized protein YndB with AHSA1/START domain
MKITITTKVDAPMDAVWSAWNSPEDIVQWNFAQEDWHTTRSEVNLREGGRFSSRMEAKDGSMGFDFEGTYERIVEHQLIESRLGDRGLVVEFVQEPDGVMVTQTFDAEDVHDVELQRQGWQAILNNFKRYVESQHSQAHETHNRFEAK